MSDNPRVRRRTALWHSFMPSEDTKAAADLASWREQAGQTLRLHTAHCSGGDCSYCWAYWPCGDALWAAFILELLG